MRRALLALILATTWAPACGGDGGTSDADTAAADGTDTVASDVASDVTGDTGGGTDTIPPLEKISKLTFKLGGVNNTFDVNGEADYIPNGDPGNLFKISGNKGTRLIEINILPVDEFAVGSWSDTEFSEVGVLICYNDGTGVRELQACPVGFTHESIAYVVTVAENNGPGSYVQGTFSGTLQDADGGTLEITEGVFDVKHR